MKYMSWDGWVMMGQSPRVGLSLKIEHRCTTIPQLSVCVSVCVCVGGCKDRSSVVLLPF